MTVIETQKNNEYLVNLDVFQGPLDLLLYLINQDEVDINEISVSKITRQYLEFLDLMKDLNLEIAGEYILMAATLINIKSRLLLPHDELESEEADPRDELILALKEYRKYKEASEILKEKALLEERNVVPEFGSLEVEGRVELVQMTTLFDLLSAFKEVLGRSSDNSYHEINTQKITIHQRVAFILEKLKQSEYVSFVELFDDNPTRLVAVVTFIAILELARNRKIAINQSGPFASLRVYKSDRYNIELEPMDFMEYETSGEPIESQGEENE